MISKYTRKKMKIEVKARKKRRKRGNLFLLEYERFSKSNLLLKVRFVACPVKKGLLG